MNYKELAERLRKAESSRVQIGRLTDEFPEMTVADAYQIQLENVAGSRAETHRHENWHYQCGNAEDAEC